MLRAEAGDLTPVPELLASIPATPERAISHGRCFDLLRRVTRQQLGDRASLWRRWCEQRQAP